MSNVHKILDCDTHVLWFGDVYVGEIFIKYPLGISIRPFTGVDVSWIEGREDTKGECGGRNRRYGKG